MTSIRNNWWFIFIQFITVSCFITLHYSRVPVKPPNMFFLVTKPIHYRGTNLSKNNHRVPMVRFNHGLLHSLGFDMCKNQGYIQISAVGSLTCRICCSSWEFARQSSISCRSKSFVLSVFPAPLSPLKGEWNKTRVVVTVIMFNLRGH